MKNGVKKGWKGKKNRRSFIEYIHEAFRPLDGLGEQFDSFVDKGRNGVSKKKEIEGGI